MFVVGSFLFLLFFFLYTSSLPFSFSVHRQVSFTDPAGFKMWSEQFGVENELVEWNRFVRGFEAFIKKPITLQREVSTVFVGLYVLVFSSKITQMMLKRIMDTTHVGLVGPYRFAQFIRGVFLSEDFFCCFSS